MFHYERIRNRIKKNNIDTDKMIKEIQNNRNLTAWEKQELKTLLFSKP
ncbi:MAG: hypothetical protein ACTSVI_03080 [Promethearchaeota archaeon]